MTLFYLTACLWVFRPSKRADNAEAASIPFRNDEPIDDDAHNLSVGQDGTEGSCATQTNEREPV